MDPALYQSKLFRARKWIAWSAYLALFLIFWISLLAFPDYVFGIGTDPSFEQGLAFFLKHRLQAGVDYIFTFGPLGYFFTRAYEPDLFWWKYAWEVVAKAGAALILVAILHRQPDATGKVIFGVVFFFCFFYSPKGLENFLFPYLVLAIAVMLLARQVASVIEPVCLFALAALALMKFTLCLLAVTVLVILVAYRLLTRSLFGAIAVSGFFCASWLGLWVASGQSLGNIPSYLYGSFELTRGHTEAMNAPGDIGPVIRTIAMVAIVLFLISIMDWRAVSWLRRFALLGLFSAGAFLQWKYAITRPDPHHTVALLAWLLCIPFLLLTAVPLSRSRWQLRALAAAGGLLISQTAISTPQGQTIAIDDRVRDYGGRLEANLSQLIFPKQLKESLDVRRAQTASMDVLRSAKRLIGTHSVDLIDWSQGWIFAHDLHWQPRPVFQSYIACTPFLLQANAAFYRSEKAPDYVLVDWRPIDMRFPGLEESQALFEILRRYEPVLVDHGLVVLKRANRPLHEPESSGKVLREQVVHFGETVEVGNDPAVYQTISFRIKPTLWGRLRSLLFRPPSIDMHVATSESPTVVYQLIPSMAQEEFLLNPLVRSGQDLLMLYAGAVPTRIKSFRISISEFGPASYENEMEIQLKSRPRLVGRTFAVEDLKKLLPATD